MSAICAYPSVQPKMITLHHHFPADTAAILWSCCCSCRGSRRPDPAHQSAFTPADLAAAQRLFGAFYDFCLDEHVPADHLLRGIDRFCRARSRDPPALPRLRVPPRQNPDRYRSSLGGPPSPHQQAARSVARRCGAVRRRPWLRQAMFHGSQRSHQPHSRGVSRPLTEDSGDGHTARNKSVLND